MKSQGNLYEGRKLSSAGSHDSQDYPYRQVWPDAKAPGDLVKVGDTLTDMLTDRQKEMFEDYMTAQCSLNI